MADKRDLINSQNTGFFQDLIQRVKLIGRLMADKRVNFFLKILPVASVVYLISPIDFAPGLALPIIGALDDAAILWLGTSLFVSLCPDEVVQEHLGALNKVVDSSWRDAKEETATDIVEVQPRDEQ
ncbi:MAG: DUF1232 domain-containing protein [Chloroflexi bacterium]|nr:DUF1232 domain-containing protein [Chloroflexota bacterium]